MSKLTVQNATKEEVTVFLTFGVSGPVCPTPASVDDFPILSSIPGNPLQGKFSLAAGATQEFDPKGKCFTGNVGFFIAPQCPIAGADFHLGKEGTNIGEFTLNVTKGEEAFDISCVNGVNCWMKMSVTGTGWSYGSNNTPINSIENKALQHNQGNPGVYPVNCTDCIRLLGASPCPSLPIGPAQTERICNIERPVQSGSDDTLTVTLQEGRPPS
ncbi:MAG: hypothetical protein J7647_13695 [Cyanobacteria bacterium SBLK]|nr:hypothetical protein [Cyanobacteria bacterium SBLK]